MLPGCLPPFLPSLFPQTCHEQLNYFRSTELLQGCSVNKVWSVLKGGHGSQSFVLGSFFFWPMGDLNFPPGIKLVPPAEAMRSLSH